MADHNFGPAAADGAIGVLGPGIDIPSRMNGLPVIGIDVVDRVMTATYADGAVRSASPGRLPSGISHIWTRDGIPMGFEVLAYEQDNLLERALAENPRDFVMVHNVQEHPDPMAFVRGEVLVPDRDVDLRPALSSADDVPVAVRAGDIETVALSGNGLTLRVGGGLVGMMLRPPRLDPVIVWSPRFGIIGMHGDTASLVDAMNARPGLVQDHCPWLLHHQGIDFLHVSDLDRVEHGLLTRMDWEGLNASFTAKLDAATKAA